MTLLLSLAFVGSLLFVAAHGSCPAGDLSCDDGQQCISSQLWCDKNGDCSDGSDEAYCRRNKWYTSDPNGCESSHFLCNDGRCVPLEAKCNGYEDCQDESDERDCGDSDAFTSGDSDTFAGGDSDKLAGGYSDEIQTEDNYERNYPTTTLAVTILETPASLPPAVPNGSNDKRMQTAESTYAPSAWEPPETDARTRHSDWKHGYTQRPLTVLPQQPPTPYPQRSQDPQRLPTPHPQTTSYPQRQPSSYLQRSQDPYAQRSQDPYPQRSQDPQRPPTPHPQTTSYPQRQPSSYLQRSQDPYAQRSQDPYAQRPPYSYPHTQRPHDPYTQRPHDPHARPPYSRTYNEYYADSGLARNDGSAIFSGRRKTPPTFYFQKNYTRIYERTNERYVRKGAEWLMGLRNSFGGWNEDTPRALVALALLNNSFVGGSHENDLMKKYFQVHLGVKLLSPVTIGLNQLASFVNALLATCQDPRDFLGTDVLQLLKQTQAGRNFSPFVDLSLCLANEDLTSQQSHALIRALTGYLPTNERGKDMLSLSISAFSCRLQQHVASSSTDSVYTERMFTILRNATSMLLKLQLDNGSFGSVYSTALAAQALLSVNDSRGWNPEATFKFLKDQQRSNGSFGDLLATYYVLPALRGRSLLHLRNTQCHSGTPQEDLAPQEILSHRGPKQYIRYFLHFGLPLSNAYSIQVLVPQGITFFDVMRVAEFQNKHFNFLYDKENETIRVYSISDVPNDWERGFTWHLYLRRHSDTHFPRANEAYTGDIRQLLPRADQHIIFWYHPIGVRL